MLKRIHEAGIYTADTAEDVDANYDTLVGSFVILAEEGTVWYVHARKKQVGEVTEIKVADLCKALDTLRKRC
jgi:hypothetical protein